MSIKDKYGVVFYSKIINGIEYKTCNFTNPEYYNLSFISRFDAQETSEFIDDLNRCINHQFNISDFYLSDSIENTYNIEYQYPNIIIDDIVTIPMKDLQVLLQKWLKFIS